MSASSGKRILLGVSGGVAAFKAVLLLRELRRRGCEVRVAVTENALRFVGEPTFHALSGRPVEKDVWDLSGVVSGERHVELAAWADAMIVYPATERLLGAIASGITDDLLSLTASCMRGPVLLCPAMHTAMVERPLHAEIVRRIAGQGITVMPTAWGELASGERGLGRLPEPAEAADAVQSLLRPKDLAGLRVLVSAGPTREPIDPVRFVSNASTGRMGFAVAREAAARGASVTLVAGPTELATPAHVARVDVVTAREMKDAMLAAFDDCDVVVMTAAVADFRPAEPAPHKAKKADAARSIVLEPTDDVLLQLGARKGGRTVVGFAMETRDLRSNAARKLRDKNLDFIVANDLSVEGAGFAVETNAVVLLFGDGRSVEMPLMSKDAVAERILDEIAAIRGRLAAKGG